MASMLFGLHGSRAQACRNSWVQDISTVKPVTRFGCVIMPIAGLVMTAPWPIICTNTQWPSLGSLQTLMSRLSHWTFVDVRVVLG